MQSLAKEAQASWAMSYYERKRSGPFYMEFFIISSSACEKHLETVFGTKKLGAAEYA